MPLTKKEIVFCILNGFLIGIANLIPGVSGGTFALILGLYDRLITAITAINGVTLSVTFQFVFGFTNPIKREHFAKEMKRIDFWFLAFLGFGLLLSVVSGAKLIQFLLQNYPAPTLALFIGLIIPSLSVPYKLIENHGFKEWIYLVPGILLTVVPSFFMGETSGSENPLIAFITGAIAISAMILPGISGSYIMLVLGEYQIVIAKLSNIFAIDSILFLGAFALGCLLGLIIFTHFVKWLFKKYKSHTMTFLLGLILGSFFILWPFKDYLHGQEVKGRSGEVKRDIQIATAKNILPTTAEETMFPGIALIFGIALGVGLNKLESLNDEEKS
jgi:putative membrane protein